MRSVRHTLDRRAGLRGQSDLRTSEKQTAILGILHAPVLPFALEFLLVAPLVLGVDVPEMGPLYLFLFPWLLFVLAILNLPLLAKAFRVFEMDVRTRRNHALEHATIYFFWAKGLHAAGRAATNGFRVSAGPSPREIRVAFEQVRQLIHGQSPLTHVSRHCGSNRVTALALGFLLLAVVAAASVVAQPPLWVRVLALVTGVDLMLDISPRMV